MEKKNTNQSNITTELIANVGCNLVLIPATIVTIGILVILGFTLFRLYFLGDLRASVEPFQDIGYLVVLAMVVLAFFAYLWAGWKNITMLYAVVARYSIMRQEKARIDRLINSNENIQHSQNQELPHFTEETQNKQSR